MSQAECCVGFWNRLPVGTSHPRFLAALKRLRIFLQPEHVFLLGPYPASVTGDITHTLLLLKGAFSLHNIRVCYLSHVTMRAGMKHVQCGPASHSLSHVYCCRNGGGSFLEVQMWHAVVFLNSNCNAKIHPNGGWG